MKNLLNLKFWELKKQKTQLINLSTYQLISFTMAEIIIAMTVIGVLAVITLPSLTSNIDDKSFATRRVALYSRLSQAVGVIDSLSDAGRFNTDGSQITSANTVKNNAAMAFVLNKLSQGIKIENTCTYANLDNCGLSNSASYYARKGGGKFQLPSAFNGINSQFTFQTGSDSQHSTVPAAFTTKNGDSIIVYYNPDCLSGVGSGTSYKDMVCANFLYDLNGKKGPNMVGKDVGVGTILFSTGAEVVMPMPLDLTGSDTQNQAITECVQADFVLPSRNDLISMALNRSFLYKIDSSVNPVTGYYWSGTNLMGTNAQGNPATFGWQVEFGNNSTSMRKKPVSESANYLCAYPLSKS